MQGVRLEETYIQYPKITTVTYSEKRNDCEEENTTTCDATMKYIHFRQLNINKCLTLDVLLFYPYSTLLPYIQNVFLCASPAWYTYTHNIAERCYISLEVISLLRFHCLTFNFFILFIICLLFVLVFEHIHCNICVFFLCTLI